MKALIGKTVTVNMGKLFGISFLNKHGGTGMTNWDHDEKFSSEKEEIKVIHSFYDDEVGYRFWGEATSPEFISYLERNGDKNRVYFTEHDIL